MGRLGDVADILMLGLVAGGGYLAYRAWKGLPGIPAFEWPSWPALPALPAPAAPVDVTLGAGVDIPLITFETLLNGDAWVPLAALEAESETVQQLADLLEAAYAMDPVITIAEITESEVLAWEALAGGLTDF